MSNVTAIEEIRQDKKALEELIQDACISFEKKYPGFKIEGIKTFDKEFPKQIEYCELQIKIPWL